jgi:hypothetical protein
MGFLDALVTGGLKAYAAGSQGDREGRLLERKRQREQDEAQRQRELDATRMALEQAQIGNYQSETAARQAPKPRKVTTVTDAEGQVHRVDADTGEDLGVLPFKVRVPSTPDPIAVHRANRDYDRTHPLPTAADRPTRTDAQHEAEGAAFLGSNAKRGNPNGEMAIRQFGEAYQAVRAQHPDWSPGQVAYAAKQGMVRIPAPKAGDYTTAPEQVGGASISAARDLVQGLDPAHATAVLKQARYTDAEIQQILGTK